MLFLASDLLSRAGVPPVLDSAVLVGSDGEGAAVGLTVGAPSVDPLRCAPGSCSPGISPLDLWHPTIVMTVTVSPRTIRVLVPSSSRRQHREGRIGEACPGRRTATSRSERPDLYG